MCVSLKISLHSAAVTWVFLNFYPIPVDSLSKGGTEYGDGYVDGGIMPISPVKVGTSSTKWQCVFVNCLISCLFDEFHDATMLELLIYLFHTNHRICVIVYQTGIDQSIQLSQLRFCVITHIKKSSSAEK